MLIWTTMPFIFCLVPTAGKLRKLISLYSTSPSLIISYAFTHMHSHIHEVTSHTDHHRPATKSGHTSPPASPSSQIASTTRASSTPPPRRTPICRSPGRAPPTSASRARTWCSSSTWTRRRRARAAAGAAKSTRGRRCSGRCGSCFGR